MGTTLGTSSGNGAVKALPGDAWVPLAALDACPAGVLLVDPDHDPARARVLYANRQARRMMGDADDGGAPSGNDLLASIAHFIGDLARGTDAAGPLRSLWRHPDTGTTIEVTVGAAGTGTHLLCYLSEVAQAGPPASREATGQPNEQAAGALPPGAVPVPEKRRTLLLVDDEPNIVSALKRLLRRDGYEILTANSGSEGLDVLAAHEVDVIVSDQRMPGMIGADFLRAAKERYPDTIRIMLSGYTELQSVTDAVNEGAIYKFLTKPWEDEQLRGHIAEAFRLKRIADENDRLNLELRTANAAMAVTNQKMEELLREKQQQISRDEVSLGVAREVLQHLPLPVIGLDDEGMVAFLNAAAGGLFRQGAALLGNEATLMMPELFPGGWNSPPANEACIDRRRYRIQAHRMGSESSSRGSLITLTRCEEAQ